MRHALCFLFDEGMQNVLLFKFGNGLNGIPAECQDGEEHKDAVARKYKELTGGLELNPKSLNWFGNIKCSFYLGTVQLYTYCYCGVVPHESVPELPNTEWHPLSEFDNFHTVKDVNMPNLIRLAHGYFHKVYQEHSDNDNGQAV